MNSKKIIALTVLLGILVGGISGYFSSKARDILGAVSYDVWHFGGDVYQGSNDTLMMQNGYFVGPYATTSYVASTWDYLGSTKLAATATSTAVVTIPKRDYLVICVSIPSYAGTLDIGSLRFNGDTAADYSSRYISFAAGTSTATDNASTSVTLARLFAQTQSTGRSACAFVANSTTKDKFGAVTALSGTGNQATSTTIENGGFEWATTTQITSVQLLTMNGGNLAAGTGFAVFGKNF